MRRVSFLRVVFFSLMAGGVFFFPLHAQIEVNSGDMYTWGVTINKIKGNFLGKIPPDDSLMYIALSAVVNALQDRYSFLYTSREDTFYNHEDIETQSGRIGIETSYKTNGKISWLTITKVEIGGPASRAGLTNGDRIFAINGILPHGLSDMECAMMIRGIAGTIVTLRVVKADGLDTLEMPLQREPLDGISWGILTEGVAYVKIPYFGKYYGYAFDIAAQNIFDTLKNVKDPCIVIDLRGNVGGYLSSTENILSFWLDTNTVYVKEYSKREGEKVLKIFTRREKRFSNWKTIVLVNKISASASEVFAGALQDYGMGNILGEETYGKNSVQTRFEIPPGYFLNLTSARWKTPKGDSVFPGGLTPDYCVLMTEEDKLCGFDPQLEKAARLCREYRFHATNRDYK